MKLHMTTQAVVMGLCLSLLANGEAKATKFTLTTIADTSGSYNSLNFAPTINNIGDVAFEAGIDGGGEGIFKGNGTTTTTIADTNGSFSLLKNSPPSINDAGNVAFAATLKAGGSGIFVGNGATTTTIVTAPPFVVNIDNQPIDGIVGDVGYPISINNSGTVVFNDTESVPNAPYPFSSLVTTDGRIIGPSRLPQYSDSSASINDLGVLAYSDYSDTNIYTNDGGTTSTIIVSTSSIATIPPFSPPNLVLGVGPFSSINNKGFVAFIPLAFLQAGGTTSPLVLVSDGTTTTTIADTSGPYSSFFGNPSINDLGTVAFGANLSTGGSGLFIGPDPAKDKVISVGDPLLRSTVTKLAFSSKALNNSGQVTFYAQLANGTSGIFRADPCHQGKSQ